jgi:acetyl-CoA carboxylase biotin carboxyl carrier protein
VVTSPSPGIFWCAPEPGAPPFTDVGLRVDASSTIGIVEIMKLMNHVKASVAGEVVAVFVANGVAVERDDPLVAVMPDPGGAGR